MCNGLSEEARPASMRDAAMAKKAAFVPETRAVR
jgi:hypothetical protein